MTDAFSLLAGTSAIRQPAHRAPQRHGRHHSHSACGSRAAPGFSSRHFGMARRRALGGTALHAALSAFGTALSAAPAGRPRPYRQHGGMAPRAVLVQYLAADGRGLERVAGDSIRRGDRFSGRGPFGIAGTLVGRAHCLWQRATARECRQHVLHATGTSEDERHACRRTGAGAGGSGHLSVDHSNWDHSNWDRSSTPMAEPQVEFPVDPDAQRARLPASRRMRRASRFSIRARAGARRAGRPSVMDRLRRNSQKMDYIRS